MWLEELTLLAIFTFHRRLVCTYIISPAVIKRRPTETLGQFLPMTYLRHTFSARNMFYSHNGPLYDMEGRQPSQKHGMAESHIRSHEVRRGNEPGDSELSVSIPWSLPGKFVAIVDSCSFPHFHASTSDRGRISGSGLAAAFGLYALHRIHFPRHVSDLWEAFDWSQRNACRVPFRIGRALLAVIEETPGWKVVEKR